MVNKTYVGAHASIAKGYEFSMKSIAAIGGNAAQIFLKNPRGRAGKPLDENEARIAKSYLEENDFFLIGHCSYLLNFAKPFSENPWAVESLIDDLIRMSKLGGTGVVLHIGKYLDYEKDVALKNIRANVSLVLDKTPNDVKVIFENTAGQGTEIGFRFEELSEIYNSFNDEEKSRIGFCLDTCHSHVAGYDLSSKDGVDNWQSEFDKNIGWDKVLCVHFNDAKKEAGARVDRHEDLGFGTIGNEGLREVAKICANSNVPIILETPSEKMSYEEQIKMINEWI